MPRSLFVALHAQRSNSIKNYSNNRLSAPKTWFGAHEQMFLLVEAVLPDTFSQNQLRKAHAFNSYYALC